MRSLKDRARRLGTLARTLGRSAGRLLRPPVPWNGKHHPAVERFAPWQGEADGRFSYDFLGARTDPVVRAQFRPDPPGFTGKAYPSPSATYFELVFVLESVLEWSESPVRPFTMFELGAGYGPWLVTAARAVELIRPGPLRLVGVEMEPQRHRWMTEHLRNNGIDPEAQTLIQGAVSDCEGSVSFAGGSAPEIEYGLRVTRREAGEAPTAASGNRVTAPAITLGSLMRDLDVVDLIHVDVQGEEERAIRPCVDELRAKARRLLVATHSRAIHRRLERLLPESDWARIWSFRLRKRERTPYGDVQFLDGLLALRNRAL